MPYRVDEQLHHGMAVRVPVMTVPSVPAHQPVLVHVVLDYLRPRPGAVIVDGTLGVGGHTLAIAPRILPDGQVIGIDRDTDALAIARERLREFDPNVTCQQGDFRDLTAILSGGVVDGILLDLGMSSLQLDTAERGFAFGQEGPLDMRMDREVPVTAATLVNEWPERDLADIIARLGEERFARRIAGGIVKARHETPITTTAQLVRVIVRALPPSARHGRRHAATRTFQALRMAVNDELGALEAALGALAKALRPGGRAVIISFHSLEDRLVKRAFREGERAGQWNVLTKKPVRPSTREMAANPRARSAKLRAVERV